MGGKRTCLKETASESEKKQQQEQRKEDWVHLKERMRKMYEEDRS